MLIKTTNFVLISRLHALLWGGAAAPDRLAAVMLRNTNRLQAPTVCRSKLAQAAHVLEQVFVTAHACAGPALVPIAVPERCALVLSNAGTPGSD